MYATVYMWKKNTFFDGKTNVEIHGKTHVRTHIRTEVGPQVTAHVRLRGRQSVRTNDNKDVRTQSMIDDVSEQIPNLMQKHATEHSVNPAILLPDRPSGWGSLEVQ